MKLDIFAKCILMSFFWVTMCTPKKSGTSHAKHVTGQTRRNLALINTCSQAEILPGKYPHSQAYAFAVLEYIAKKNPDTFKNEISTDRLCIQVLDNPRNRVVGVIKSTSHMQISSAMLSVFQSDAELAAILAHELAHISGGHEIDHLAIEPKVLELVRQKHTQLDEAFFRAYDEVERMNSEIRAKMPQQDSPEYKVLMQNRDALKQSIQQKLDIFTEAVSIAGMELLSNGKGANWKEQEADEIGFEFYLKAGFSAASFWKSYYSAIGDAEKSAREKSRDCATRMLQFQRHEVTLERGYQAHPEWCWRIHNLIFSEFARKRKTDYRDLLTKAQSVNLFPDLRKKAVDELKGF